MTAQVRDLSQMLELWHSYEPFKFVVKIKGDEQTSKKIEGDTKTDTQADRTTHKQRDK